MTKNLIRIFAIIYGIALTYLVYGFIHIEALYLYFVILLFVPIFVISAKSRVDKAFAKLKTLEYKIIYFFSTGFLFAGMSSMAIVVLRMIIL